MQHELRTLTNDGRNDSDQATTDRRTSSPGPPHPPNSKVPQTATACRPPLRYHKTSIWLLVLYLPTLIVPWVLTCVLDRRPLGHSTYWDQTGNGPTTDVNVVPILFIQLLSSLNSVLVIPIISTLLAHAAVVYAMRRAPDQKLDMLQLFVLADKKWTDITTLWSARTNGKESRFLWHAALLVLVAAVTGPLKSILLSFEQIGSVSWADIPPSGPFAMVVGYDPEPADMSTLDHDLIVQDVLGRLATVSDIDAQINLWPINPDAGHWIDAYQTPADRRIFIVYSAAFQESEPQDGFFVTALENGTLTGVLREHAIRLNSSVACEHIPRDSYPSPCPGARPLDVHIARPNIQMRVCAPGNSSQFPFTPSRNRQDITEYLYIDFQPSLDLLPNDYPAVQNYTLQCTASTSRGYFELGNEHNNNVYGPLLSRWPDAETMANEFNDVRSVAANWSTPTEE